MCVVPYSRHLWCNIFTHTYAYARSFIKKKHVFVKLTLFFGFKKFQVKIMLGRTLFLICILLFCIIFLFVPLLHFRGGSRTAATSKMGRFVIIVNTIITKRSILVVAAVLGPPLLKVCKLFKTRNA